MNASHKNTPQPIAEIIGERVKRLRERAGMTGGELAEKCNALTGKRWTRQEVSRIERGARAELPASALLALAAVLDTTLYHLLDEAVPVDLGGGIGERVDALAVGAHLTPEARARERFDEAGEALSDVRDAWNRYLDAMTFVRERIAEHPELRAEFARKISAGVEWIESELSEIDRRSLEHWESLDREHWEKYGEEYPHPPPGAIRREDHVPAVAIAAQDALSTRPPHPRHWARREGSKGQAR